MLFINISVGCFFIVFVLIFNVVYIESLEEFIVWVVFIWEDMDIVDVIF